ncbi:MAG TPA: histidine ammonia-lyase, partial [Terriglobales bacterium]
IEAAASAQALDLLAPLKTSMRGQKVYSAVRSVCKFMQHDRSLSDDFARLADLVRSGKLREALE